MVKIKTSVLSKIVNDAICVLHYCICIHISGNNEVKWRILIRNLVFYVWADNLPMQ